MTDLEKPKLSLGFIPLTDCAPLVVAKEHGYFEKYGLQVELSKETSWANIRDKVAIGVLDGAQMLAPMPIAMSLGLGPIEKPMVAAMSLDLNGNAITVSASLFERMQAADPQAMQESPISARALKKVIEAERGQGKEPLTFAMVFPTSTHNYLLRYWMAAAGIDPDRDVRLLVTPPPQMVGQLRAGEIDGYCVGEPWNTLAVTEGLGHVLITSYELWNNGPEKVLGVSEEWAEQHPHTHRALISALVEASRWIDLPDHRREVGDEISRSVYVNAPPDRIRVSMTGTFQFSPQAFARPLPDFNVFYRYAANFPWRSHAVWLITQMLRWGQIDRPVDIQGTATSVYRTDIYRAAVADLGVDVPRVDYKTEGGHDTLWRLQQSDGPLELGSDRFFDQQTFNPADPVGYLRAQTINNSTVSLDEFEQVNPPLAANWQQNNIARPMLAGTEQAD